jgi:FkbM family methyltransferase
MYSQNNEEEIILKHLGHMPTGRFLDIGAFDGITLSNTYRLYESAWNGVLVDPSPIAFVKLMETYSDALGEPETDIRLVNAAVVPGPSKLMVLHDASGDPLSTMNGKTLHLWPRTKFYPITINTVNIIDFLDFVGYDFDMISMDADGMNLELFLSLPLDRLNKLKMIVVEHEGYIVRMTEYLGAGWTLIHTNPENAIYIRNES